MPKAKKIKDFDKETMYRKIMPSSSAEKKAKTAEGSPPAGAQPARPQDDMPHNYMQDMVLDKLEHTMKVLDACPCERCRNDIIALSLNQLPAAYAVVPDGAEAYLKKRKGSCEVKVTTALIKAIQQVKKSPRH